jgi:hypothetical protein
MSFIIAQILVALGLALICLFCELLFAISVFKILIVTHFNIIFPADPDQLGSCIFAIGSALAVLPSAVLCSYQTYHGQMMNSLVAYLTKLVDNSAQGVAPLILYIAFWVALCLISMLIAMLYIPYYIEHHINSNAIQIAEEKNCGRKQISLKRIMISIVWVTVALTTTLVTHHYGLATRYQPHSYVVVFSFNLFLASYALEKDVSQYLCKRRHILDRMPLLFRPLLTRGAVGPHNEQS